ncbi:MAG: non-canonical purine NTP diphosphatase [Flavobacteriales bacterium]
MKLVFATHNKNKLKEVQSLLPKNIELLSLSDIACFEEIPETENTLEGNALLKANYIKQNFGYNCFADDTGLEVEALNQAPGVYSARYAGPENNANKNMDKLLKALKNQTNRTAQFKTVIALVLKDKTHLFTGICKGEITIQKSGTQGFGYDPIFQPQGFSKTFAEMTQEQKNKIGHRGIAIKKLLAFLSHI